MSCLMGPHVEGGRCSTPHRDETRTLSLDPNPLARPSTLDLTDLKYAALPHREDTLLW